MPEKLLNTMQTVTPPDLHWVSGTVGQVLVQPGEKFYVFTVREASGTTVILRIGDAHTGRPLSGVTSDNTVYDLLKESYFRKLPVQVGYRNFGPDPQSGIDNCVIDRVSLTH